MHFLGTIIIITSMFIYLYSLFRVYERETGTVIIFQLRHDRVTTTTLNDINITYA